MAGERGKVIEIILPQSPKVHTTPSTPQIASALLRTLLSSTLAADQAAALARAWESSLERQAATGVGEDAP